MGSDPRAAIGRLDEITRRLRAECPWDREQDARSIVTHTVEEAYELADAIAGDAASGESAAGAEAVIDELGDVLFQVIFLALLLSEQGRGDLAAVAESCSAKLIRRHPHVFGDAELESASEVLGQWERIKREVEGRPGSPSDPLEGVPENLPALLYARKAQRRLDPEGRRAEEPLRGAERDEAERAVGRMLWQAVIDARSHGVDPELALRAEVARQAGPAPAAGTDARASD